MRDCSKRLSRSAASDRRTADWMNCSSASARFGMSAAEMTSTFCSAGVSTVAVAAEAARALGERVMRETAHIRSGAATSDDILQLRIRYEARLVLSRDPTPSELPVLVSLYERALDPHARRVNANLVVSKNSSGKAALISDHDLNALSAVASVLFNLDAALNR